MTLGTFNALLKGTSTYAKIEMEGDEKILWLMVEKNKGDDKAVDVPIIRMNGPKNTPAKNMIEQCHRTLLMSGTKMTMMAYAKGMDQAKNPVQKEKTAGKMKVIKKKKPKK